MDLAAVDLYGEIEQLVRRRPQLPAEAAAPGGGVATNHDALAAVAQLALAVEKPAQTGDLDPAVAYRMASLLLVVRDYLEPVSSSGEDRVARYLTEVTTALRRA